MKRFLLLALLSLALCSGALATGGESLKHKLTDETDTTQRRSEEFTSTGEPNQRFALSAMRVITGSVQITIGEVSWEAVESLADSLAGSPHFVVTTDESGVTWISFGDGVNGAIPPAGASIRVEYDHITPEPSGVIALSCGLFGLIGMMWRKRHKSPDTKKGARCNAPSASCYSE